MSALIYAQKIQKSFGAKRLFHGVSFGIGDGERVGVVGPNGSGKSTLLKILAGLESPDEGSVTRRQRLRVAFVSQDTPFSPELTVGEILHECARQAGLPTGEAEIRVYEVVGRVGFSDVSQRVDVLSGGWRKRLAIACAIVQDPDVILLDEPTNHMDVEGLLWLEQVLLQASWAWVLVSHDRWFLEQTTNKMAELNSRYEDGILVFPGTYTSFLDKREAFQHSQEQQAQALAGKVRREEAWLRQGAKARTTKAKYRVESAQALQEELAETSTRLRQQDVGIDFVASGRKTKQLIEVAGLSKSFGSRRLLHNLELMISPGKAIGIVGHNGSGKSTLLKLLAKELEADEGIVKYADKLQMVYFDQQRELLDPKMTLRRTLSDTGHTVTYRGQTIHVVGWAKRFCFQPEQLDLPVERLSGGEQARAVMARFMLQPADVLIVDEPTNDLDIPTREILEESFKEFSGALLLVTHDRFMLEKVCTEFVGLDGCGGHGHFATYGQWESWLSRQRQGDNQESNSSRSRKGAARGAKPKKLSFKEQQEFESMEKRIFEAEMARDAGRAKVEEPVVASDHLRLQEAYDNLKEAERVVEKLYARWAELEAKHQAYSNR
ncbi:MAG: ABC-F family ATP-binding cassette domain-containing protein [Nitrospirales bacterium]